MADQPEYDTDFMNIAAAAARGEVAVHRQGLLAVKKGSRPLAEHQMHFFRRVDAALAGITIPDKLHLACREGCSYCCNYHVHVSAPEVYAIVTHLRARWTPANVNLVEARLQENVEAVSGMTADEHTATNVTCAFLAQDGRCSIYEVRPVACRKHHSFDVTPCRITYEDPTADDAAPQSAERLAVAQGLFTASIAAMEIEGLDAARYEMSAAVLDALTNPSSIKRWRTGKNSFPSVRNRDAQRAT
jgi:hypothetical protein